MGIFLLVHELHLIYILFQAPHKKIRQSTFVKKVLQVSFHANKH